MIRSGCENVWPTVRPSSTRRTPPEHDILGNFQHALIEHGPYFVLQPVTELGAATCIADGLDTEANLGKCDGADEQVLEPLARNEASNPRTGLRSTQIGNHTGIEEATRSRLNRPHWHHRTAWFDLDLPVRGCLQRLDQQLAGSRTPEAIEFVGIDNHRYIAAMQGDVLRPITMRHADEFTEARLGVLKTPSTARRLRGRRCRG